MSIQRESWKDQLGVKAQTLKKTGTKETVQRLFTAKPEPESDSQSPPLTNPCASSTLLPQSVNISTGSEGGTPTAASLLAAVSALNVPKDDIVRLLKWAQNANSSQAVPAMPGQGNAASITPQSAAVKSSSSLGAAAFQHQHQQHHESALKMGTQPNQQQQQHMHQLQRTHSPDPNQGQQHANQHTVTAPQQAPAQQTVSLHGQEPTKQPQARQLQHHPQVPAEQQQGTLSQPPAQNQEQQQHLWQLIQVWTQQQLQQQNQAAQLQNTAQALQQLQQQLIPALQHCTSLPALGTSTIQSTPQQLQQHPNSQHSQPAQYRSIGSGAIANYQQHQQNAHQTAQQQQQRQQQQQQYLRDTKASLPGLFSSLPSSMAELLTKEALAALTLPTPVSSALAHSGADGRQAESTTSSAQMLSQLLQIPALMRAATDAGQAEPAANSAMALSQQLMMLQSENTALRLALSEAQAQAEKLRVEKEQQKEGAAKQLSSVMAALVQLNTTCTTLATSRQALITELEQLSGRHTQMAANFAAQHDKVVQELQEAQKALVLAKARETALQQDNCRMVELVDQVTAQQLKWRSLCETLQSYIQAQKQDSPRLSIPGAAASPAAAPAPVAHTDSRTASSVPLSVGADAYMAGREPEAANQPSSNSFQQLPPSDPKARPTPDPPHTSLPEQSDTKASNANHPMALDSGGLPSSGIPSGHEHDDGTEGREGGTLGSPSGPLTGSLTSLACLDIGIPNSMPMLSYLNSDMAGSLPSLAYLDSTAAGSMPSLMCLDTGGSEPAAAPPPPLPGNGCRSPAPAPGDSDQSSLHPCNPSDCSAMAGD